MPSTTRRYWYSPGSSSRTVRHSSCGPFRSRIPWGDHFVKSPVTIASLAPFARAVNGISRVEIRLGRLRSVFVGSIRLYLHIEKGFRNTRSSARTTDRGQKQLPALPTCAINLPRARQRPLDAGSLSGPCRAGWGGTVGGKRIDPARDGNAGGAAGLARSIASGD